MGVTVLDKASVQIKLIVFLSLRNAIVISDFRPGKCQILSAKFMNIAEKV
jgi:hypothetical protein